MNKQNRSIISNSVTKFSIKRAVRDQDGGLHYLINGIKGEKWLNLSNFMDDEKIGFSSLSDIGLIMLTTKPKNDFKKQLEAITNFEEAVIATQPGFVTPSIYVFPNGEVCCSKNSVIEPIVSFETDKRYTPCGSLNEWKNGLDDVIEGNPVCSFLLSYSLLPFILKKSPLKFNPTVELISPPQFGKSGVCVAAASIHGGDPESDIGLGISWDMTKNAFPLFRRMANDGLMFIDESNMQGADIRQSGLISFIQSSTGDKGRYTTGAKVHKPVWSALLSNGNELPKERFKGNCETLKAAESRRITITLDEPLFSIEGWQQLRSLVDKHYGWASRYFVKNVINSCEDREEEFQKRIIKLMKEFKSAVAKDNIQSQRILDVCALTYAAGKLAKEWEILPSKCMEPLNAVRMVLKTVQADQLELPPKSAEDVVREILTANKSSNRKCKKGKEISKLHKINDIFSYIEIKPNGVRIVYCHAKKLRVALGSNQLSILQKLREAKLLIAEKNGDKHKLTTKAPKHIGFDGRVYKFKFTVPG